MPKATRSACTRFTHANLCTAAGWRRSLELRQSQLILAGATGVSTTLLRPPYSSAPDALTDKDWTSIEQAREAGYLTVLSTQDSEDWRRPGTTQVIANSMPRGTAGQVLLMHDAGGDRSQTIAALAKLIPVLKARGFTLRHRQRRRRAPAACPQGRLARARPRAGGDLGDAASATRC